MSEEKKTPAKKTEPGKVAKILNWFKTLPQRIVKPFRNMYYELKKVTWPSKERLITYSTIVLCFMLVMGVVIGLLDMGASTAVRSLISTSAESTVTTTTEDVADEAEAAAEAGTEAADTAAETVEQTAEAATDAATETVETAAETVTETAGEGNEGTADAADEGK